MTASAMKYGVLRWAVRLLCRAYLGPRFQLEGREWIPRSGGCLVCTNHIGTIDPAVVPAWVNRPDSWSMAKAESLRGHGLGTAVLRAYHAFGVVRHTPDRRALRRAREILEGGGVLFLYPEGHRAWDGRLQRAEPGAGFLARVARVPVAPVAIVGSNHVIERGRSFPRRRPVTLRFGPPFRLLDHRDDGSRVTNQEAADAIMLRIADMLPESMWGEYAARRDDPTVRALAVEVEKPVPTVS
ncbi:MAG: 1-acyl-sn-glycerol-3-phosphate acyltransferase [Candidatus Dormibacteraeota bacterium]|nr:1-acyl-sn-glycerol-3-phosphate acyltransferase [Candidatus Dormibacteraeota bacterium]